MPGFYRTVPQAYLNYVALPIPFKYTPLEKAKRFTKYATSSGTIVQFATNPAGGCLFEEGTMEIKAEDISLSEAEVLRGLYQSADCCTPYLFCGYWGDTYYVHFTEFKIESVKKGGLFDIKGSFEASQIETSMNEDGCTPIESLCATSPPDPEE